MEVGEKVMYEAMYEAAQKGDLAAVSRALAEGASPDGDGRGYPLLCAAIEKKQFEVAKVLIHEGACIDLCEQGNGMRPLHFACLHGWHEGIKELVARGASIEQSCWEGQRPIDLALGKDHFQQTIGQMLSLGADINGFNGAGRTLLHCALHYLDPVQASKVVPWLISHDADPTLREQTSYTDNLTPLEIVNERQDWTAEHNCNWLEGLVQARQAKSVISSILHKHGHAQAIHP